MSLQSDLIKSSKPAALNNSSLTTNYLEFCNKFAYKNLEELKAPESPNFPLSNVIQKNMANVPNKLQQNRQNNVRAIISQHFQSIKSSGLLYRSLDQELSSSFIENSSNNSVLKLQKLQLSEKYNSRRSSVQVGNSQDLLLMMENNYSSHTVANIQPEEIKQSKIICKSEVSPLDLEQENEESNKRLFKRHQNVFDSIDEDEVSDNDESKFIIKQSSSFRLVWDYVIFFCIIYTLIFVPYYVGFSIEPDNLFSLSLELFTDFVFLVDMVLNFFYTFEKNDV